MESGGIFATGIVILQYAVLMHEKMIWLSDYLKNKYGYSPKKILIDAGFTCPNRDGTLGYGGCIFCSQKGSGDFTKGPGFSVERQIEDGKIEAGNGKYIAYFQAFTNTYGSVDKMRDLYMPIAKREDIEVISIATRPDCLSDEIVELLKDVNRIKPVWIELGLQTVHEEIAKYIRRGYDLNVYESVVRKLYASGISQIITHVILGLPGENHQMMLDTVKYVGNLCEDLYLQQKTDGNKTDFGIKLQLLHVLEDTDLAVEYKNGKFECLTFDEYVDIASDCLKIIPQNMIVHRITGDGDRNNLIAPLWSRDKKKVMNAVRQRMMDMETSKKDVSLITESSLKSSTKVPLSEDYEYAVYENLSLADGQRILPVFLYGISENVPGDEKRLFDEVKRTCNKAFVLVAYKVKNWNDDFSPWQAKQPTDKGYFGGNGVKTKEFLCNDIIPFVKDRYEHDEMILKIISMGYSLAGLFSMWAYYELRPGINGAVSCSGSLWFPGFEEYMEKMAGSSNDSLAAGDNLADSWKKKDIFYLSLGGKESSSGNPVMDRVGEITKRQFEIVKKDKSISKVRYDINKGGHFADPVKRLAKGITWCLSLC